MTGLDRVIHEPARLALMALLAGARSADFLWLERESGLTRGNLSSHLARLEAAGYVEIEKTFKGKVPLTLISLSAAGRKAFAEYRRRMSSLLEATGNGAARVRR